MAGDLYSIETGDGTYSIVKILAVDDDAVHLRLYKNRFPTGRSRRTTERDRPPAEYPRPLSRFSSLSCLSWSKRLRSFRDPNTNMSRPTQALRSTPISAIISPVRGQVYPVSSSRWRVKTYVRLTADSNAGRAAWRTIGCFVFPGRAHRSVPAGRKEVSAHQSPLGTQVCCQQYVLV
jgi:hypothetical protein